MRLVCASICYRGYEVDEFAATLANAPHIGYRHMEIHGPMTSSNAAIAAFDLPKVKQQLGATPLRCVGIYSPTWGGKNADEVHARAKAIAQTATLAHALGAERIETTGAEQRTPGSLDRIIDCVHQALDLVPATNPIRLTVENHHGNAVEQIEDFQQILDAVPDPRFGVCLDVGHFHASGVDSLAAIRQFAARLYGIHLKDHIGAVSVGVGRGEIDLAAVVCTLKEVGYAGDLIVELEVEDPGNLPRYTTEAYIYLNGLLGYKL